MGDCRRHGFDFRSIEGISVSKSGGSQRSGRNFLNGGLLPSSRVAIRRGRSTHAQLMSTTGASSVRTMFDLFIGFGLAQPCSFRRTGEDQGMRTAISMTANCILGQRELRLWVSTSLLCLRGSLLCRIRHDRGGCEGPRGERVGAGGDQRYAAGPGAWDRRGAPAALSLYRCSWRPRCWGFDLPVLTPIKRRSFDEGRLVCCSLRRDALVVHGQRRAVRPRDPGSFVRRARLQEGPWRGPRGGAPVVCWTSTCTHQDRTKELHLPRPRRGGGPRYRERKD